MTKINLIYNPFKCTTEMKINDKLIPDTNFFNKYKNTPIENWIETFITKLIDSCNDDEIKISFEGLRFNFEALKNQIQINSEKYKEVKIELEYVESKPLKIRMQEISNIIDRICNDPSFDIKEKLGNILEKYKSILEVVVVSSDEKLKLQVISDINKQMALKFNEELNTKKNDYNKLDDTRKTYTADEISYTDMCDISLVNDEKNQFIITYKIDNESLKNHCHEYKKSIINIENVMILFILNSHFDMNSKEILDLIAEQYKEKELRNKESVIFVADNLISAKKYLANEFAINSTNIYTPNDILLIKNKILRHVDEYFLVQKIKNTKKGIEDILMSEKLKFCNFLDSIKTEIDRLENENINLYNSDSINNKLDIFIQDLTQSYKKEIQYKYLDSFAIFQFNEKVSTGDAIENSKMFIEKNLEIAIEDFINEISLELYSEYKIEIESVFRLIFDCPSVKIPQDIMEKAISFRNMYLNALPIDEILTVIKNNIRNLEIIHKVSDKKNIPYMVFMNEKGDKHEKKQENDTVSYEFYDGMFKLTELELLCNDEFLQPSQIALCVDVFENNIIIIKPVLLNVLGKVKEYIENRYQEYKDNFKKTIIPQINDHIIFEISFINNLLKELYDTTELKRE